LELNSRLAALRVPIGRVQSQIKTPNHRTCAGKSKKERGARKFHKRLFYYFNVNRTSLDHLLLGESADVDRSVE
jgi:hypothetical protein